MLKRSSKRISIVFMAMLIILVSFFRDHFFKSINEQLRLNYYELEVYAYSFLTPFISSFSSEQLNILKYILTLAFSLTFMLLCLGIVHILFGNRRYLRYTVISYISVFILTFLIYLTGYVTGSQQSAYELARNIGEFLQSPLLILILVAIFFFDSRYQQKTI